MRINCKTFKHTERNNIKVTVIRGGEKMKLVLSDATEVEVEYDGPEGAFDTQGMELEDKKASFANAVRTGGTILKDAIGSLNAELQNNPPSKLELQIGLKFGVEGNVVVAKGTAEAIISVNATWGE
jgi:hypothetical protein